MWIPKTELEIEARVLSGSLEETAIFDAKKELPAKNAEIAKDIAAMTNDGGVIIFGIDEDASGRPTVLHPIPLAGQPERITAIVQTSIAEPPKIVISTIPTTNDQSIGYLVVVVPPSDRAPHMVVVKGDNRYYGRTATGNHPLNEGDVARLYERRQRMDVDRDALITAEIAQAPYEPHPDFAYLHLVARPVFHDEALLNRAVAPGETAQRVLFDLVAQAAEPEVFPGMYSPDFYENTRWVHRAEGFITRFGSTVQGDDQATLAQALDLQVDFDGSAHLFCGRAADRRNGTLQFFAPIVAGNTTRLLSLLGKLYTKAAYLGLVDIGVAITGLKGSVLNTNNIRLIATVQPYDRAEYRRSTRVSAIVLSEDPKSVAKDLMKPLFDAMSQGSIDPFSRISP